MILKMDALLRDLAQFRERENLVTAAISQDRPIPAHEAVKSAEMPNHLHPGPNEKMVGVSENDLRLQFAQLARTDGLDTPLGPDRHEGRRFNHAVGSR